MIIQTTKEWFYIAEETSDIDRSECEKIKWWKDLKSAI